MRRQPLLLAAGAAALLATYLLMAPAGANAADRPVTAAATIPPGAVRVAEFLADCPASHRLPDDPIIFPGLPGASHMHSFFGSTATDAHSTVNDLLNANSNCNPSIDKSASVPGSSTCIVGLASVLPYLTCGTVPSLIV